MQLHNNFLLLSLFVFLEGCVAQQCTKVGTAFCVGPSLKENIILRCTESSGPTPQPGNCDDNLRDVPPIGIKDAFCWESSPTAGDAQCTFDCVAVTAANGTTFFPLVGM
ncbi:hypothetical protein BGZ57DRAFT_856009 [Hyaloscypha finlandica]|nr:hypothetical protein F5882DRAFT_382694 [Hyaloscypha sp. PMI_1271]KAH8770342.1 hypothetical protein BGZ57DRAFT_856009 [Hyaloscypha finlandica]